MGTILKMDRDKKQGLCSRNFCPRDEAIPQSDRHHSLFFWLGFLNIFFPGFGTIVAGCVEEHKQDWVIFGFVHLFASFFFIGWIWSIIWGVMMMSKNQP